MSEINVPYGRGAVTFCIPDDMLKNVCASRIHKQCAAAEPSVLTGTGKFMEMKRLTAPLLRELIDRIEVYETEGTGKSRTQRIVIYYRFIGYIEIPDTPVQSHYRSDIRQGVEIEYIPA